MENILLHYFGCYFWLFWLHPPPPLTLCHCTELFSFFLFAQSESVCAYFSKQTKRCEQESAFYYIGNQHSVVPSLSLCVYSFFFIALLLYRTLCKRKRKENVDVTFFANFFFYVLPNEITLSSHRMYILKIKHFILNREWFQTKEKIIRRNGSRSRFKAKNTKGKSEINTILSQLLYEELLKIEFECSE